MSLTDPRIGGTVPRSVLWQLGPRASLAQDPGTGARQTDHCRRGRCVRHNRDTDRVTRDSCIDKVIALERRLLQPSVRASSRELAALLDPDFREVGASGRVWDRASIIESLTQVGAASTSIRDEEMEASVLADGIVLLTYVSDAAGRRARRTSIWKLDEAAGWRLLHHQGTPAD